MKKTLAIITFVIFIIPFFATARQKKDKYLPWQPVVRFTVKVNTVYADHSKPLQVFQDSAELLRDRGVLLLPESYSQKGMPARLIISCHGAGGGVTENDSQIERAIYTKYLLSLGYAVMDMNGLATENMGGPLAVQAYLKGYYWVVDHYNIRKDGVFITGASMGGLTSNNLVYTGSLPVIAQAAFCPVLDLYNQAWKHPWLPTTLSEIAHWYNFKGYVHGQPYKGEYQDDNVKGFNPILNRTFEISGTRYKIHPVPIKIWHASRDPVVSYQTSLDFIVAIKNAGGYAEIRTFDEVSHEPQDLGPDLGNFTYLGKTFKLKTAVMELGSWFGRFN